FNQPNDAANNLLTCPHMPPKVGLHLKIHVLIPPIPDLCDPFAFRFSSFTEFLCGSFICFSL
ncbi:hypothetical protein PIB30_108093, partial [Stylosanthes scabra]|nr:hypothetical protein [Stylosanthes scabra]